MHTRWLGPRCISSGSVSEQTRGPDLLPTIPGTEAAVLDGEASPDLSKADGGRTRCQAMCHGCAGPAGMLGGVAGLTGCRTGGVGPSQAAEHPQQAAPTLLCRCLSASPRKQPPLLPWQTLPENSLQIIMGLARVLVGTRVLPFGSRRFWGRKGCAWVSSFAQEPKRNQCPCSPSLSSTAFTRHHGEVCGSQAGRLCPSCPCGLYGLLLPKPLVSCERMTEFPALEH